MPRAADVHIWDREANEHYVEPRWCSERLFAVEHFYPGIWDPCCGFGRIPEAAIEIGLCALGTDIKDRGYRNFGGEFNFLTSVNTSKIPHLVCNPPFNAVREFAEHALKLGSEKVAMIFPTARLNAANWLLNTPLVRIWLLTPRPSMPPGHVIAAGEKPGGGKMDFCWLVWEKGFIGNPEIRWLHRDKVTK